MTLITKLMIDGYATPTTIYKLQDATCNLFNTFMAVRPASCERKALKDLTDTFVVENFMIEKNGNIRFRQKAIDSSVKKLLKKLYKLGITNFDVTAVERAIYRVHKAASLV